MIFENKKRFIRHQYTIIELLVVLVIAGLLTGMTVSGIKGALARQGATGAVRTLASKISLAQSFAVSKNRHVALLVPDYDGVNTDINNPSKPNAEYVVVASADGTDAWTGQYISCFRKNRLCYVTKNSSNGDYEFDRWIDGYEWQTLPPKTVAFITNEGKVDTSSPSQVKLIPDPTSPLTTPPNVKSTALIFKPSGALVNASSVIIRIFRAAYVPGDSTNHFVWQGTEDKNKGWKIVINGFTGRSRFCLGGKVLMIKKIRFFNMIEVLLALTVIAVGMTSVLGLFPVGLNASREAIAQSCSADVADQTITYLRVMSEINQAQYAATLYDAGTSIPIYDDDNDSTTNYTGADWSSYLDIYTSGNSTTINLQDDENVNVKDLSDNFLADYKDNEVGYNNTIDTNSNGMTFQRVAPGWAIFTKYKSSQPAGLRRRVYFIVQGPDCTEDGGNRNVDYSAMALVWKEPVQIKRMNSTGAWKLWPAVPVDSDNPCIRSYSSSKL